MLWLSNFFYVSLVENIPVSAEKPTSASIAAETLGATFFGSCLAIRSLFLSCYLVTLTAFDGPKTRVFTHVLLAVAAVLCICQDMRS